MKTIINTDELTITKSPAFSRTSKTLAAEKIRQYSVSSHTAEPSSTISRPMTRVGEEEILLS